MALEFPNGLLTGSSLEFDDLEVVSQRLCDVLEGISSSIDGIDTEFTDMSTVASEEISGTSSDFFENFPELL